MVKMFVEWMKAANDDLILLNDIKNNEQITNLTAFHSQQAVEKTLKAVLEYRREEIPKMHKIQSLVDKVGMDLTEYEDLIQLLDKLYIDARYPGDLGLLPYGKPTLEDAKEFYDFAFYIFERVRSILSIDETEL